MSVQRNFQHFQKQVHFRKEQVNLKRKHADIFSFFLELAKASPAETPSHPPGSTRVTIYQGKPELFITELSRTV